MYEWNDILIVGDSFCSERSRKYDWPKLVTTSITDDPFKFFRTPRGKGFGGGSWWATRTNLLEELNKQSPKVLIVCHTEPFRIPNDNGWGLNFSSVETGIMDVNNKQRSVPKDVLEAAVLFYKHLFSKQYAEWAVTQWFIELDQLCKEHKIEKVIHLYCFTGPYTDYTFTQGVTVDGALMDLAEESSYSNHFSLKRNKEFAHSIVSLIQNYAGNGIRLTNISA